MAIKLIQYILMQVINKLWSSMDSVIGLIKYIPMQWHLMDIYKYLNQQIIYIILDQYFGICYYCQI